MLRPDQRHALLLADRTLDLDEVHEAVSYVLSVNPNATLMDCEMAFRDAAAHSYLISTGDGFRVVIGMFAWRVALGKERISAEQNHGRLLQYSRVAASQASSPA